MAKIEVNIRKVIDDIGPDEILKEIRPSEFNQFFANISATELGRLMRETMSPESILEMIEALR